MTSRKDRAEVRVRAVLLSCATLLTLPSAVAQTAPDWTWVDGFDDEPTATAFRFTTLALRDPHVFVSVTVPPFPAQCLDITDPNALLPQLPSVNAQIANALTADADADGFVDSSPLVLFRPLRAGFQPIRVDSIGGQCTFPLNTTNCGPRPAPPPPAVAPDPAVFFYTTEEFGTCLGAIAGTIGSPAYNPPVGAATAMSGLACFTTGRQTFRVDGIGNGIPLVDAQIAARFSVAPVTALTNGLLRGFLPETAANLIQVPLPNPPGGTASLSSLLPGGTGNCSTRNDKDIHRGEAGWWFYFNFSAAAVPYGEP